MIISRQKLQINNHNFVDFKDNQMKFSEEWEYGICYLVPGNEENWIHDNGTISQLQILF